MKAVLKLLVSNFLLLYCLYISLPSIRRLHVLCNILDGAVAEQNAIMVSSTDNEGTDRSTVLGTIAAEVNCSFVAVKEWYMTSWLRY
jgi:hypothetical protein